MLYLFFVLCTLLSILAITAWKYPQYLRWILIVGILLLFASLFFWEIGLISISLGVLIYLALQVSSGKISGSEGVKRALIAYILLIVGSWVSVDLFKLMFWENESKIISGVDSLLSSLSVTTSSMGEMGQGKYLFANSTLPDIFWPIVGVVLIVISITSVRSAFSAVSLGLGLFLTFLFGMPIFIQWVDSHSSYVPSHPFRPALIFGIYVFFALSVVKLYNQKK